MAGIETAVGRRFGDPSDPLLVSVRSGAPVSMPGMMDTILNLGLNDATDGRAGASIRQRGVRAELSRAVRRELPLDRRRRRRPRRPVAPAAARDRGRVPVLEQRPGHGVSPEGGDPGRSRDGGDRPGDGLRQPRRDIGDRRRVHAQPGDRRADALRRRAVRRPGRGRRRRDAPDRADRRPRRAPARRSPPSCAITRPGSSATTPTCATSSSRSRTAGSGCSRSGSASAARRRRSGSRSTWPRTSRSRCRGRRRSSGSPSLLAHPPTTASGRSSFVRPLVTGLPASPGMASGPIVTSPEAAQAAADDGTRGDPRPGRDLARRRPRHGQGGRDPDVARRPGEPRRGRRPRLGDPRGRRGGRDRGPRR